MSALLRHLSHFAKAQEGIAYFEFAIIAPILVALLTGSIELTRYMLVTQKIEKVAMTIPDITAQGQTVSTADLDNFMLAAAQLMKPYDFGADGYVIITSVSQSGVYSAGNQPKVNWQYAGGGSFTHSSQIGSVGANATIPGGMILADKDNIIIAEVYYNYKTLILDNGAVGNNTIYRFGIYRPRLGALTTLSALPCWFNPKEASL